MKYEERADTQYPPVSERPQKAEYPLPGNEVTVSVHRVYGCCPISVEGDEIISGSLFAGAGKVSSDLPNYMFGSHTPATCSIALTSVFPFVQAMCLGISALELGIAKSGKDGYVMCPAWGPPTCEALVIFKLHPEPIEKSGLDEWYEDLAKAGHISVPSYFLETFAADETKTARKKKLEEWEKAGRPKFWEGWRNPPCQPHR